MKSKGLLALFTISFLNLVATQAWADEKAKLGEKEYKKCAVCHSLEEGKKKVGPSLYQVIGRQAGAVEGFKYSKDLEEAGQKGLKWSAETLIAYLEDPKKYLATYLKKDRARSKMINKYANLETREKIAAYLVSLQPEKKESKK